MSCRRTSSQSGFFPHMLPEGIQPIPRGAQVSDRKDPLGRPWQTVQDIPRCSAQPDRARPRLAVRQIELPLAVEAPLEGQDLRLAAPCEEKEPDSRRVKRAIRLVTIQDPGEAAVFFGRQKSLGSCLSIAANAPAGVAVLGAVTPGFRLLHDDGQDRRGTVRRGRRGVERAKPVLHVLAGYRSDGKRSSKKGRICLRR